MAKGYKTGGRKKGTSNKLTTEVKAAIEAAFAAVGGSQYLERIAIDHPAVFCTLLAKVLPRQTEISGPDGERPRVTFITELDPPDEPASGAG